MYLRYGCLRKIYLQRDYLLTCRCKGTQVDGSKGVDATPDLRRGGRLFPKWKERTVQRVLWEKLWETLPAWGNLSSIEPGYKYLPSLSSLLLLSGQGPSLAEPAKSQRVQEALELVHTGRSFQRRLRAGSRWTESESKMTNRRRGRHFCYFVSWLYPTYIGLQWVSRFPSVKEGNDQSYQLLLRGQELTSRFTKWRSLVTGTKRFQLSGLE